MKSGTKPMDISQYKFYRVRVDYSLEYRTAASSDPIWKKETKILGIIAKSELFAEAQALEIMHAANGAAAKCLTMATIDAAVFSLI